MCGRMKIICEIIIVILKPKEDPENKYLLIKSPQNVKFIMKFIYYIFNKSLQKAYIYFKIFTKNPILSET